jgi:anti-anti-sigma factor
MAAKLSLVGMTVEATRVRTEGDITQLDLRGNTDMLEELLSADCFSRNVYLNMEKTNYIDSAGVGWLVKNHKRFQQAGGRLEIHGISPMVMQILKLLRMPEVLNIGA